MKKLKAKPAEMVKLDYRVEAEATTLSLVELNELLSKVGIAVEAMEVAGKFVLIGADTEIDKAEDLIKTFRVEPSKEATEVAKSYEIVGIPEGFNVSDVQTIVRKIGIEVEIVSAGEATLLVGRR